MLKRINAVSVCIAIVGIALIVAGGFLDGDNYVGVIVCIGVAVVFGYLAAKEDGQKNSPL